MHPMHRADFRELARLGPTLDLTSVETRTRKGESRVVIRYEFHFHQDGRLVYYGDQSAVAVGASACSDMFVRGMDLSPGPLPE